MTCIYDNLSHTDKLYVDRSDSFYTEDEADAIDKVIDAIKEAIEVVSRDELMAEIERAVSKADELKKQKRLDFMANPFKKLGGINEKHT